jgi:hypothetical protein
LAILPFCMWGFRLRDGERYGKRRSPDGIPMKKLYVRPLNESDHQGFIDSALDTGIDNVDGHALHVRSEMLRI